MERQDTETTNTWAAPQRDDIVSAETSPDVEMLQGDAPGINTPGTRPLRRTFAFAKIPMDRAVDDSTPPTDPFGLQQGAISDASARHGPP